MSNPFAKALTPHLAQFSAILGLSLLLFACGGGGGTSQNALVPGGSSSSSSGGDSSSTSSGGSAALYSAVVEWDIPDTRENGDKLPRFEIGGYEILFRKTQEDLPTTIVIPNNDALDVENYLISDLTAGRYEVRIAAFDTDGLYSDYSSPAYADIGSP